MIAHKKQLNQLSKSIYVKIQVTVTRRDTNAVYDRLTLLNAAIPPPELPLWVFWQVQMRQVS